MSRYLEYEEETKLKSELETLYLNATSRHNDGLDILMVPYLKRLNSIKGVATEQSCQGHSRSTKDEGITYIETGCLWIRLSESKYKQFLETADKLYLKDDQVFVHLYIADFSGRHDVIDIKFNGAGRGSIESTMEFITKFFEDLKE